MTLKERIENRGTKGGGWEYRGTLVKGAAATVSLHPVSANVQVPGVVPYLSFVRDRRDASRSLYSRGVDQWCEEGDLGSFVGWMAERLADSCRL